MTNSDESGLESDVSPAFATATCDVFNEITQAQYRTTRHGAHQLDEGESDHTRSLWPGVDFTPAFLESSEMLVVHFTFSDMADAVFGCRVHLPTAKARWAELVDVITFQATPDLIATELVWFVVCYIGASHIEANPAAEDDITWLMDGPEVFGPLPR